MEVLIPSCEPFKVVQYEEEGRHIVLESLVPLDMVEEYIKGKESALILHCCDFCVASYTCGVQINYIDQVKYNSLKFYISPPYII